jgi:hypothetical protein
MWKSRVERNGASRECLVQKQSVRSGGCGSIRDGVEMRQPWFCGNRIRRRGDDDAQADGGKCVVPLLLAPL